jgi:hypothetical protein
VVVLEETHEHGLGRLGFVEEGLGAHLEATDLGGMDFVVAHEIADN